MPEQDGMTDEARARRYWGSTPTCYWVDRDKDNRPLRLMKRPIDQNFVSWFMSPMGTQTFEGIVLFDSFESIYADKEMLSYLLSNEWPVPRQYNHLNFDHSNMKHILHQMYKSFGMKVLLVQYDEGSIHLSTTSDVSDFIKNFPMTLDFNMIWLHGGRAERFKVISKL